MSQPTRRRRSSGEGSLYQTSDGRWRGAVSYVDGSGTARRRYVSGPTAAKVRERVTALSADVDRGLAPSTAETIATFLPRWLEAEKLRIRPATWRGRELHVRSYLVPEIGRIRVAKLTAGDVERAMARLSARGLSPLSIRHARATLRRALGDAQRDGLTAKNSAALARPPRIPHRPITYLDAPDVRRLLEATADDELLGPAIAVAVSTGLRVGELLGLGEGDVDVVAGTVTVRRALARSWSGWALAEPKTARSRRTIVMPKIAALALVRRREIVARDRAAAGDDYGDDGLLFCDRLGRPVTPDALTTRFRTAADRIGLAIDLRSMRHTAATLALAEGQPITSVSEMLGHTGIAITAQHYAAVTPELKHATARAIDRALDR